MVDSGAKSNVAGCIWVENYIDSLSEEDKSFICEEKFLSRYRFGDGEEVDSDVRITLPVVIGGQKQQLTTSVIKKDLPMLLSFDSLNRNSVVIDFGSLLMDIAGQSIPLKRTESGHLLLPLSDKLGHEVNIVLQVRGLENLNSKEKETKMRKLHIQLAHASKESLIRLLSSSNINDAGIKEALVKVVNMCDFCRKYKRKPLRPCVSEPLSEGFNSTVAMDLKTYVKDSIYILHLICLGTKYSAATVIKGKHSNTILRKVLQSWIHYFGAPRRFLTDNGKEFANDVFKDLCEHFNVVSITTPGESPWSNGVVERHNGVLYETVRRVMDEQQCDLETALPWAVCAKNTLSNISGYSPNILVFGRNPNEPSVLHDSVPALEPCTTSELVRKNMELRVCARKAYICADASERIRRALRMKLRTSNSTIVDNGDSVFYRRRDSNGWKGPGTVLGRDGQIVVVRHGGQVYRVPVCHILPLGEAHNLVGTDTVGEASKSTSTETVSDTAGDTSEGVCERDRSSTVSSNCESDTSEVLDSASTVSSSSSTSDSVSNNSNGEVIDDNNRNSEGEPTEDIVDNIEDIGPVNDVQNDWLSSDVMPAVNSTVKFKTKDDDEWHIATILSKGGTARGKNKFYLNIRVQGEEKAKGVHWNRHVDVWKITKDEEHIVLFSDQADEFKQPVVEAKQKELENWTKNNIFEKVKDTGQRAISSRWVFTEKAIPGSDKTMVKARLVCRGYEEDSSTFRTDSPTCTKESLRLCACAIASNNWECESLDVSCAFLQGYKLERVVYMRPPYDIREHGVLWKLLGCPYGLNDAPRSWFRRVRSELKKLGVVSSQFDEALFYYRIDGKLAGVMVLHVDDFLFGGNKQFQQNIIQKLLAIFDIRVQNCMNFKYIGLDIIQTKDAIVLNQHKYVRSIECVNVPRTRNVTDKLNEDERKCLRSLCGQLLWVSNNTRPDVSFETSTLCNVGKDATVSDLLKLNKLVKHMQQDKVVIKYPNLGDASSWSLVVFCDASFGNLADGSSQGGCIVFIKTPEGVVAPISWTSRKLHRVTRSTLASETLAVIEGVDSAMLLRLQIQEIFNVLPEIKVFTDSRSLHQTVHTSKIMTDKSQRIVISYLRQFIESGEITISWIDGNNQIADALTKLGASPYQLREVLDTSHL